MARASNPVTFATHFGVEQELLNDFGVFNPTLAIDSKLFVDPLLLASSGVPIISNDAGSAYRTHFERIVTLMVASRARGDIPWRTAERLLDFHEVPGTCLGYSAGTVFGRGFGPTLTGQLIETAYEIVQLGIRDPDLFLVLALLEDGVGPDLISDMTTNVILDPLLQFNAEIIGDLELPTEIFHLDGHRAALPRNPFLKQRTPVILVPKDVLRDLPVALDWEDVSTAASESQSIRDRVNRHIGAIWERKTRRDKHKLRELALASRESFQTLLDAVHAVPRHPYDITADPLGRVSWAASGEDAAQAHPLALDPPARMSLGDAHRLVGLIISQFGQLVEHEGLARNLWYNGQRLPEKYSQYLFFAVAHAYCKANNLDLSPEVDTGTGRIDFKFSTGFEQRVLVELKLSTNSKVVAGYTGQLEAYKRAQATTRAYYLVIDVGSMGTKRQQLQSLRNRALDSGSKASEIVFVDGNLPEAASRQRG